MSCCLENYGATYWGCDEKRQAEVAWTPPQNKEDLSAIELDLARSQRISFGYYYHNNVSLLD